mmetsp:Transcript_7267/g.15353  ORF Transcript_7267/g.15353 Transcript_7267/m.15353 type:complete len:142 (-) Transcript_7267:107-532(-)
MHTSMMRGLLPKRLAVYTIAPFSSSPITGSTEPAPFPAEFAIARREVPLPGRPNEGQDPLRFFLLPDTEVGVVSVGEGGASSASIPASGTPPLLLVSLRPLPPRGRESDLRAALESLWLKLPLRLPLRDDDESSCCDWPRP